ncbi:MAG: hypothetical protein FJX77_15470 [Armatimonadetes bacterium]|nr:hypothetical protein [Armatimonadota bacterium]
MSVVRYLIPGRGRVDGLTPSFSPSVSGKTVKMDISIFNTCRDPAKEVSVKELFVEQGEKQFQPLGFKIPQTIGFIKGQGTTNLQVEFPAEALAGSPGLPQRIVIGGEKLIGASPPKRCLAWRDFVNLPPIPGLVRSSLPATPRRTSAPHIRNVECEAQGGRP